MVLNKVGRDIPQPYADQFGVYAGELAHITPYGGIAATSCYV